MPVLLSLLMMSHAVNAEPSTDTGNCQWEDVMELLNHINDTASEPAAEMPVANESDMALCYESNADWTQLYVLTSTTWEPMGIPVSGSVIDALSASPNDFVKQMEPTFVLPCAIMGTPDPSPYTVNQYVDIRP